MKTLGLVKNKHIYHTLHHYLMLIYAFEGLKYVTSNTADHHLELAKKFMSTGKYSDALPHFHEAINSDPKNYLTYFKRATVLLALNRPKSALSDLDKALDLNKNFTSALIQRANLHLKLGNLDESLIDSEQVIQAEPRNQEAIVMYQKVENLQRKISDVQSLLLDNMHDTALLTLNSIIDAIPWNSQLLTLRASTFEKVGETRRAINDYRNVAKLDVDAKTYLNIAKLSYSLGDLDEALSSIRECLKLDPDSKICMDFYKPAKKLNYSVKSMLESKESRDNDECYTQGKEALRFIKDKESSLAYSVKSVMCHCLSRAGDTTDGLKLCNEVLSSKYEGVERLAIERSELLCDKADLLADLNEYSEALKLFQESQKLKSSKRAKQGIDKMNKLKKQKSKRNYYRILGVSRSAGDNEINKAYRKLAAKWHPDRFQDADEKKKAQTKFMDIADAKAVLTDKEKRQIYDAGEDPLDPESKHGPNNHGFYGDPFSHFGSGAPFTFKFNF